MDKKLHYNKYDAGLGFLSAVFMPSICAIVFLVLVTLICTIIGIDASKIESSLVYNFLVLLVTPISFLLCFLIVNKSNKVNWKEAIGIKQKLNIGTIVVCIIISLISVFGITFFVDLFDGIIKLTGFKGNYSMPIEPTNIWLFLLNIIPMAVLPAIFEEVIFRGVIFNGLKDYGNVTAVYLSATLFMLIHSSVEQTIYPFVVGVILGFIMLKTNNIIYPIITHFANNFTVLLYNFITLSSDTGETTAISYDFSVYNILFAILTFVLSILAIWLIIKHFIKSNSKQKSDTQKGSCGKKNTLLNIGIICSVIIWLFDLISGFIA